MKYALIAPHQEVTDFDGQVIGSRVAEVCDNTFPVAQPLYWIECDDSVVADRFHYVDGSIVVNPDPPAPAAPTAPSGGPNVIA